MSAMLDTKFCELSSLVLVDILAALPMERVVKIASLGHERLRQTCSLKWVKDRMTNVTFEEAFRAYQLRDKLADSFCAGSVLKRFNGKVKIPRLQFKNFASIREYAFEFAKEVTGRLHLCTQGALIDSAEACSQNKLLQCKLGTLPKLIYSSHTCKKDDVVTSVMCDCPEMVFEYNCYPETGYHSVLYRPALLNGRHIVDVLRAVCGSADVSEAELERVRRKTTKRAEGVVLMGEEWEDLRNTWWRGAAITAKE